VRDLPAAISERETAVRAEATRLRAEISRLDGQLTTAEHALERLQITRETVLELTGTPDPTPPPPDAYRNILALFDTTPGGLHTKQVCQALGTGTQPRHIESTRHKLKRLVSHHILTEPEPGLFVLPDGYPHPQPTHRPQQTET
jgi:hypothetical protein